MKTGATVALSDKATVKEEQHILKDEDYYENKEKNHVQSEEKHLKEERKLLDEVKSAYNRGDKAEVDKLEKKLDKAVKAETRDASIIDKVIGAEHDKENQLQALFSTWASSSKHPSSKWLGKHDGDVNRLSKDLERAKGLEVRTMANRQAQATFLEERSAFEQARTGGRPL